MQTVIYTIGFVFICLASHRIGKLVSIIKLPYITGYLFAGALVGSFALDFIPSSASEQLRFIDELALAVIAFMAGSELYLKEIRRRLNSILWSTGGIVVFALTLGAVAIYIMTEWIPFTQGMETTSRFAVALLGSTVLLALSPPSTIAVIKEVRAKGPFTRMALSVTVFMDVVIIVLFAISTSIASALLTGVGIDLSFIALLALDLSLALGIGYLVGHLLKGVMGTRIPDWLKTILVLAVGYGIFFLGGQVKKLSVDYLGFEIYIEPLLIALIGGFFITNFTAFRDSFEHILHKVGPAVYVAFFTLTGLSLKLDILWATLPIAMALFGVRMLGIFIGSYAGSTLAKESQEFRRFSWMSFITQAGIALGLAREVAVQFPALGDAFATLIISVIVLNEIFGPLFLKAALKRAGETNLPEDTQRSNEQRDVLILGIEGQSLALARQLREEGWSVLLADTDASHVKAGRIEGVQEHHVSSVEKEALANLLNGRTDALVTLLPNDADNLKACEVAFEKGVPRLVVRPDDLSMTEAFQGLGVRIVDTASAMVNLLDQAVRAPQSAALMLHQDPDRDVVQVTISSPDIDGLYVRDLRLPNDVLLIDVTRNGESIVPSGYTVIRLQDEVTLLGPSESLEDVTLRLGY